MYLFIKRFFDFIFSILFIFLLSPVFFLLSLLIFLDLKEMPIFYQKRAGLHGKPFYVYKFKTMSSEKDEYGRFLPDNERLSRIGKIVRKLSLDELPQLFNVTLGSMSFIGPRPFLFEYMSIYTEYELRRHDVRPGISGWAQVNGRNTISWKDKFELDIFYVDNVNFSLDVKIFFMTLKKALVSTDVNQSSNITMEKYNGKN